MSTKVTDDGLTIVHKGRGDHRVFRGNVGARTEPRFEHGDISLWRFSEGQRYSLFLSIEDAQDLADALDELLNYVEENPNMLEGKKA